MKVGKLWGMYLEFGYVVFLLLVKMDKKVVKVYKLDLWLDDKNYLSLKKMYKVVFYVFDVVIMKLKKFFVKSRSILIIVSIMVMVKFRIVVIDKLVIILNVCIWFNG